MPDEYTTLSPFDRRIGALHDLPDVVTTSPSTVRTIETVTGRSETFIVQTYRQHDRGDTIAIEYVGADGTSTRLALPPKVAAVLARQRDAIPLWDKAKRRAKLDGGRRMRHVLLDLIKYYVAYGIPPFKKVTRQKRQHIVNQRPLE
jgi:hypothetical protein